jgi:16S rRNA (adenine1518-N6/adenine1519-N6)-dimethyltransferase
VASGRKFTAKRGPRPRLGQHFLHDQGVLDRIVAALAFDEGQLVVEIGPGQGALTRRLLAAGARVRAVEVDAYLAGRLREEFAEEPRFELIEDDILNVDISALAQGEAAVLAGNLPYYITSPIIRRVLAAGRSYERAVFLVQLETAQRIAARKGSRDYAYLSALTRMQSDPEILFNVPPGAFSPPPRVQSAVIRLTSRADATPDPTFVKFLEASFRHPRKTLLNNLGVLYEKAAVGAEPESGLRAQQLDVEELRDLWERLEQRIPSG